MFGLISSIIGLIETISNFILIDLSLLQIIQTKTTFIICILGLLLNMYNYNPSTVIDNVALCFVNAWSSPMFRVKYTIKETRFL